MRVLPSSWVSTRTGQATLLPAEHGRANFNLLPTRRPLDRSAACDESRGESSDSSRERRQGRAARLSAAIPLRPPTAAAPRPFLRYRAGLCAARFAAQRRRNVAQPGSRDGRSARVSNSEEHSGWVRRNGSQVLDRLQNGEPSPAAKEPAMHRECPSQRRRDHSPEWVSNGCQTTKTAAPE